MGHNFLSPKNYPTSEDMPRIIFGIDTKGSKDFLQFDQKKLIMHGNNFEPDQCKKAGEQELMAEINLKDSYRA